MTAFNIVINAMGQISVQIVHKDITGILILVLVVSHAKLDNITRTLLVKYAIIRDNFLFYFNIYISLTCNQEGEKHCLSCKNTFYLSESTC